MLLSGNTLIFASWQKNDSSLQQSEFKGIICYINDNHIKNKEDDADKADRVKLMGTLTKWHI